MQPDLFSQPASSRRVILIDGHHLAYRSYFALGARGGLTTSQGEPVGAIYGFLRALLRLRQEGDCLVVVFDAQAPTFRHQAYEGYKAGRAATPEDFHPQVERIKALLDLLGVERIEAPGFEADDILGTLARQAKEEGYAVEIVTGDRDSFQLLGEGIEVILPDGERMNAEALEDRFGLRPEQWVDYRALTGDPSDNLPGAQGIGPKGAQKLLKEWGSLEALFAHLDELPSRWREILKRERASIELSRDLSRIRSDLPLKVDFARCLERRPDLEGLKQALEELEFGSILQELGLVRQLPELPKASWPPPKEAWLGFRLSRPEPMWAEMVELAATDGKFVYHGPPEPRALLGWPRLNAGMAKDLAVWLLRQGAWVPPGEDPFLLAYLLDPANDEPAGVVRRYGAGTWEGAAERAQAAERLFAALQERLEPPLAWLYREVELPLSGVLARMEATGVVLDLPYLKALAEDLGHQIERLEEEIHRLAGHPFNLNSRDQLEKVLYDELGLSASRKTAKTGKRSTAAGALEALLGRHPIVEKILEYRELVKLKSTYLDPFPRLVHPQTGRLHTRFNQTATATGRLSSSDPNLQNIPVRSELGRRIRRGFVAASGALLVVADYSQIELRVLAHLSGDEQLIEVFRQGGDIHTQTAAWMFGIAKEAVLPEQRRAAKTINFGVLYGMSAHRLASELNIDYSEAEGFIERYFASYPGVKGWIEKTLQGAREQGYVETLFGRRRYVRDLDHRVRAVREAAERMAFNMPVQGTAADLIKLAMVRLSPRLEALGAKMLLQVHDELVLEAPEAKAEEVGEVAREVMEGVAELAVPLRVDVGIGPDWLSAKD